PAPIRREMLVGIVRQEAMKVLGIAEPIDAARPLRELGLDSLMSVRLVNRLEAALGIKVAVADVVPGPSIDQLVQQLMPQATALERESRGENTAASSANGTEISPAGVNGAELAGPPPQGMLVPPESSTISWPAAEQIAGETH